MKKFVVIKNSNGSSNNQDAHNQFTTQVKMSGYLKKKRNVSFDKILCVRDKDVIEILGKRWTNLSIKNLSFLKANVHQYLDS